MAPALSKLRESLPLTIGIGLALIGFSGILIYVLSTKKDLNSEDQTDERHGGKVKFSKLIQMLDSDDESSVLNSLNKLCSLTAFKEFQVLVREYGGLRKISSLATSNSQSVKLQALNVMNNLAIDIENQRFLKIKENHLGMKMLSSLQRVLSTSQEDKAYIRNLIPDLIEQLSQDSDVICLAVAKVLTNLAVVDENHEFITPNLPALLDVLCSSKLPIKLQVLKILVNLSANSQLTENELEVDIQIIRVVGDFVENGFDEEILLRSTTCLANILSALRNRWQNRNRPHISTAEFVTEIMERRLTELQHHKNENIAWNAERALVALQPSVDGETPRTRENADLIEVLQL